ncbi:unnamed protein product [Allacma fusca]|uniref:ADP-ribosylation factor n=1 Tax=Allacma fusca TaxID=39272 RepID=A0A8J2NXD8_9HEXA|nr:unnamed protein product [Allacma fusca]
MGQRNSVPLEDASGFSAKGIEGRQSVFLKLKNSSWNKKIYRKVLILSLDAAGKTSILYWFKYKTFISTIPTIGYNHETLIYKTSQFDFWDVGGQDGIRKMWQHYFMNVQAVIFVVDSNDRERISEVKDVLQNVQKLIDDSVGSNRVVMLILANKQDLPDAMSVDEVHEKLKLKYFLDLRWHLHPCCTKTGEGLKDALEWLHCELKKRF